MDEVTSIKNELKHLKTLRSDLRKRLKQTIRTRVEEDLLLYEGSAMIGDNDYEAPAVSGANVREAWLRIPYDGESFIKEQAYVVLCDDDGYPSDTRCICAPRSIATCLNSISDTCFDPRTASREGTDDYASIAICVSMYMKAPHRLRGSERTAEDE